MFGMEEEEEKMPGASRFEAAKTTTRMRSTQMPGAGIMRMNETNYSSLTMVSPLMAGGNEASKKKKKAISRPTTMATTAKPVGINGGMGAVKAQPSATAAMTAAANMTKAQLPPMTMEATTPSVLRNTIDDSKSDVDIACSTDLKSLRLKLDAASTVEGKKQVVDTITAGNPFNLEYSPNALVELLVLGIKMDKINHPEQFNEEQWSLWLDGREDFHNRANEIHFDSSVRIKKGIADALMVNNANLPQDAVLAEGAFLVENMHMLILISRYGEPTIHKASEFKPIMEQKGFGKIIEATTMNVSPAPLNQQSLMKSGAEKRDCATKIAYLDILTLAATKAIFDKHETIDFVFFSISDLLASIGPKYSTADNSGSIPPEEVLELHVRRKLANGYAGINSDIVSTEVVQTARELGLLCREKNTFIVVNSAKARDVLLKNDSQLEAWSERTVAYGCALCCFQRAGAGSWRLTSLRLCALMQQLGHGGIELALLSKTNSSAFLKVKEAVKEALKEATFGKTTSDEITDERLEELASNHCERLLCYQGEFAADDGNDGPLTSNELLSCFGRKGGKAKHAKQGHFDRTKDSTGYNACAELAELGWSEDQLRNVVGETKKGKGFCLYKSFLASNQPPSQSRQSFTSTGYSAKFDQVVEGERRQQYGGGGGARMNTSGKVAPPVKTLAAVEKMKELAQKGEGPPVSRYAYVPKEEGTVEEKLKQLQKAIGMDDESQHIGLSYRAINCLKGHRKRGANLWNSGSSGYLACQKLRKDDWTADSLHRELQNRSAQEIFIKFCEYAHVVLAPMNKSDHPYFEYVSRRSNKDKQYSTDEERQGTLRAIFMLQELVRKIEAGEVTPPTGENLE